MALLLLRSRRTPDVLALLAAGLVLLGVLTGLAAAVALADRSERLAEVSGRGGPLTLAAVDLYQALSDADATSTSAFLSGGSEPRALAERYRTDVARAAAALSVAARSGAGGESGAAVAAVQETLPVYTGLVETARVYNRQGLPVGAAYLRAASSLNRERLLPAAQELYRVESARLAATQRDAGATPWTALGLGAALLGGLAGTQVWVARRTHRVLNPGLLTASLLAAGALGWLLVGTLASAGDTDAGRRDGTAQIELLAQARIAALQARGDEALTLVGRGGSDAYEVDFAALAGQLPGMLERAGAATDQPATRREVRAAQVALGDWLTLHGEVRAADDAGRYAEAVSIAVGTGSAQAGALDASLGTAIGQAADRFARSAAEARRALSGAGAGVPVLLGLAAAAALAGLWPRLQEYR